jgi:ribonuclease J
VADFGPRNLERLFSFLEVAGKTGRMLLAQPKDIYMLEAMHLADPAGFPAMFADPKTSPRGWETGLRQTWEGKITSAEAISNSPGDYLLADSLWDLNDLIDLHGVHGGAYLFSNSRAYDDEQKADLDRLRAWVNWMGLTLYGDPDDPETVPLHASGHACGRQLVDFVLRVNPQIFIPIHTEDPAWWIEQLGGTGIKVILPEYGVPIDIESAML